MEAFDQNAIQSPHAVLKADKIQSNQNNGTLLLFGVIWPQWHTEPPLSSEKRLQK